MSVILAFLGAVIGAVIGGAVGFFGYVAVGYATGADSQQGAIAMGAATVGLPLGLVVGGIAGCLLALRMRRNTGVGPGSTGQNLIALGGVLVVIAGLYGFVFWEPPKPRFKAGQPVPVVLAQIRLPADMVDFEFLEGRSGFLVTYEDTYYDADAPTQVVSRGDEVILESRLTLLFRREGRAIHIWLSPKRLAVFRLRYPDDPQHEAAFSDWRMADELKPGFYETDVPPDEREKVFIRTRLVRE